MSPHSHSREEGKKDPQQGGVWPQGNRKGTKEQGKPGAGWHKAPVLEPKRSKR